MGCLVEYLLGALVECAASCDVTGSVWDGCLGGSQCWGDEGEMNGGRPED